ncbi:hypothetical protein [Saccharothrix violaceirubra]|uniref:Peptidase MA superfamily protein n=1 Tax=Saccharothrix violaceirubra TaxID=413306 RepID=A0A7W7WY69_9PSEU|nr:hypothetical protein [Saccharothrix violaceirubra]MBB4967726.1 hypothetical protein [Saccharothrix violaceirubra]
MFLLVVVLFLTVASVPVTDDMAVRDVLDRRSRAVLTRDETAFLADLDPHASPAFVDAQRALFRNLSAVPLAQWSYRVDDAAVPDGLTADADSLATPRVGLEYRLRDVDTVPSVRDMAYVFTRRGGRWYLASDTALERFGRHTWRGPWDFGPCAVLDGPAGFVLAHPGGEEFAARVSAELPGAVDAVRAVWGPWNGRVAVYVPAGREELNALVGPGFAAGLAGIAVSDPGVASGQRVVLASPLPTASLRVLLRHEITHVVARGATADGAPMWLLEGFADYVGYRGLGTGWASTLAAEVRAGRLGDLPSDADFRTDPEPAYQRSWSLVAYLAAVLGEPRLVGFYRLLARSSDVEGALRTFGLDRAGVVRGWHDFLRSTFP